MSEKTTISLLKEALIDGNKGSFGRLTALPFIIAAFVLASAQGGRLILNSEWDLDTTEHILQIVQTLWWIAISLYAGSKGISGLREFGVTAVTKNKNASS